MAENLPNLVDTLAVVGMFFLALIIIAVLLAKLRGERVVYPYARKAMLTPAEARFHAVLRHCLPRGTALFAKVRLADFLEVTLRGDDFMKHFGRISQKHTDFLLVEEKTGEPLLAIELDDSTHRTSRRTQESDAFKDRAYEAAGLPICRVPLQQEYDSGELRNMLAAALRKNSG